MRKAALVLAAAALTVSAGSALAAKKQLVIIVKGLDNPFFEAIHQGCEKWNKENASSPYACFYTGPASTSDEAGEAQIVGDILGKSDTAAVAISPSNAPLIANAIKSANPKIPIMTVDADLSKEDFGAAQDLSRHRQLSHGLQARRVSQEGRAEGRHDLPDRRQRGGRQHPAPRRRDARILSGKKGPDMLKGEGGWTEISGCPVFTNDDGAEGRSGDVRHPDRQSEAQRVRRSRAAGRCSARRSPIGSSPTSTRSRSPDKSLVIVAADTIGDEVAIAKEGRVEALVGQRPFEMGYKAPTVMIDLIEGKKVDDPVFTGLDECTKATADTCIQK